LASGGRAVGAEAPDDDDDDDDGACNGGRFGHEKRSVI
jgi:hypothetical protein